MRHNTGIPLILTTDCYIFTYTTVCSDIKILKISYFFVSDRFLVNNLYDGCSMLFQEYHSHLASETEMTDNTTSFFFKAV